MRRAFSVLLVLFAAPAVASSEHAVVVIEDDDSIFAWPQHPYAASVCFTFRNVSDERVYLPSSAPYWIETADGAHQWHHGALAIIVDLDPGESYGGCWGEDIEHSLAGSATSAPFYGCVPTGGYLVKWEYAVWRDQREWELHLVSAPFRLESEHGLALPCPA